MSQPGESVHAGRVYHVDWHRPGKRSPAQLEISAWEQGDGAGVEISWPAGRVLHDWLRARLIEVGEIR
jgi:hypothetical protein